MITLWFDPGLLTGVCAVDTDTGQVLYLDEHDLVRTGRVLEADSPLSLFHQFWDDMDGLDGSGLKVSVGWETYTILKGAQTQAPWSLEVIGMLKYQCAKYGYAILKAAAPAQREVCSLSILKAIGWYPRVKGKKDALSAAQHTVAWWLRTDTLPEQYHDAIYGALR